jgi:hypothetical protein
VGINWDLYNTRVNINGSTERERNLNSLQSNLNTHLPHTLSYKSVTIDKIDRKIEIVKTSYGNKKEIHSLPKEDFTCGQYVYKNTSYLITEIDNDKEVYTSGKMQECEYVLKFQLPDATILSYPCIDSTNTSIGEEENKIITVGDKEHTIKLPFDSNTSTLDVGHRLYVDKRTPPKTVYKITSVDTTTYNYGDKGLMVLYLTQDVEQNNTGNPDKPDLGICNYFEKKVDPVPPVGTTSATISQNGTLYVGGKARTLTPTFYNADKTVNTSATPVWSVVKPTGFEKYITVAYSGNLCTLQVTDNEDLIGKVIKVSVSDGNGGFIGSLDVTISCN